MKMFKVTDSAFRKYGKIVDNVDFTGLVEELKKTPCPDHVVYEPSAEALEALPVMEELSRVVYGEMPIQIGYCNGHNVMLNALEYHRDSEINVAAGDAVLMLGLRTDVEADYTYDTAKVEAFLLPAGTAVEIYATTLHYAPCQADEKGFQVAIVLPRGTNNIITLFKLNPLVYIVNGYRNAIYGDEWFFEHFYSSTYFWIFTVTLFCVGSLIFKRLKVHFADVL